MLSGRIKSNKPSKRKLAHVGRIKVGEKTDKGYPRSLDYFRVDTRHPIYQNAFFDKFGDQPSILPIVFLSDELVDTCNHRHELRNKGKLMAIGDGEMYYPYNPETKDYSQPFKKEDFARLKLDGEWSQTLTLRFAIPKTGVAGVWSFVTKSEHSIEQIVGCFDDQMSYYSTIVGIPFHLIVEKFNSQKPGNSNSFPITSLVPIIGPQDAQEAKAMLENNQSLKRFIDEYKPETRLDSQLNLLEVRELKRVSESNGD